MANRTIRTHKKDAIFLRALSKGASVRDALKTVPGYKRATVYDWRKDDAEFREAWGEAIEIAIGRLEAEADRRGVKGVLKPVGWYRGKPGGYVREYSDNLLMFRLKALAPEKYRDNYPVNRQRNNNITHEPRISKEQLDTLTQRLHEQDPHRLIRVIPPVVIDDSDDSNED